MKTIKTKAFEINQELMLESVYDLLLRGEKVSKKSCVDNINGNLRRMITGRNNDLTIFSVETYNDFRAAMEAGTIQKYSQDELIDIVVQMYK